jgi:hypothetical protein
MTTDNVPLDELYPATSSSRVDYGCRRTSRSSWRSGHGAARLNRSNHVLSILVCSAVFTVYPHRLCPLIYRCFVTPLLGAYIADTYWGRYNTICFAVIVAFIGHVLLIVAALPHMIANGSALPVFIIALIIMGIGALFSIICIQGLQPYALNRYRSLQGKYLAFDSRAVQEVKAICCYHEERRKSYCRPCLDSRAYLYGQSHCALFKLSS